MPEQPVEAVFEANNLSKTYDGRMALDVRSLRIERGRIYGLVGPNGSGKSTLLEILAGLTAPTAGELLFCGRPFAEAPPGTRRPAGEVTLVMQHPFMFHGSVRHNVEYGLRARRVSRREAGRRVESQLKALGLLEIADCEARRLSGGEMQRVSLARALVLETPVVLMDEPLSHLDAAHRQLVVAAVRRLGQCRRTVVIAAHDPADFLPMMDRLIRLEDGRCRVIETNSGELHETD